MLTRPGFRPGPLGDHGLGQLAYDKRMRVLAASQSNQAALEIGGAIGGGALTYALVHEGLIGRKAALAMDGSLSLKDLLEYPVSRVPLLFRAIKAGEFDAKGRPHVTRKGMDAPGALQVPALFDFAKTDGPRLLR